MSSPKVSIVMLMSPGREKMAVRALQGVQGQTYKNVELLAVDTVGMQGKTIGYMRNVANQMATGELIAHFDDDDWSHPRRIEEQVALLEASGKGCVGYRELLFWDTRTKIGLRDIPSGRYLQAHHDGESWIYCHGDPRWAAGASFLYRRELWAQYPFFDAPHEDQRWWLEHVSKHCLGQSSILSEFLCDGETHPRGGQHSPRLICQMHAGGTEQIPRSVMLSGGGGVWRRAPEYDAHCAKVMAL